MRLSLVVASLSPGFTRAWVRGRWEGVLLAAAFAAAVNVALVSTFTWRQGSSPAAASGSVAAVAWILVLGLWTLGLIWTRSDWPRISSRPASGASEEQDRLFREAQQAYLKGHWIEAEALIRRIMKRQPADVESRLLMASIERRRGRWNDARRMLVELRSEGAAERWQLEIDSELKQIDELAAEPQEQNERRAAA